MVRTFNCFPANQPVAAIYFEAYYAFGIILLQIVHYFIQDMCSDSKGMANLDGMACHILLTANVLSFEPNLAHHSDEELYEICAAIQWIGS